MYPFNLIFTQTYCNKNKTTNLAGEVFITYNITHTEDICYLLFAISIISLMLNEIA